MKKCSNCDHFVENFLPMLRPVMEIKSHRPDKFPEVKVVPFQFRSEDSGLDYLGYDPENQVWYHFTMVYGRTDIEREFENWNAAFDFAWELANQKDTDENDDW